MKSYVVALSMFFVVVLSVSLLGYSLLSKVTRPTPTPSTQPTTRPVTSKPAIGTGYVPIRRYATTKPAPPVSTRQSATTQPFRAAAVTAYIPPAPNPPATFNQYLGVIHLDKKDAYKVHAYGCDRATFYTMFPDEAKFYIINATQTWYWGDGTSSTGGEVTHTYPRAGVYTVLCVMDIGFRGGAVVRLNTGNDAVTIPEPKTDPIIEISDLGSFQGTIGGAPETKTFTITNTGGRPTVVRPYLEFTSGSFQDFSWVDIQPKEAIILNDSVPVTFSMVLDWTNAPQTGNINLDLKVDNDVICSGWYVKYNNGTVMPPP